VFPDLKKSIARALYESPALLGALPRPEISNRFPADVVASLGIYVFEHLYDREAIAYPYGRIAFPDRPIYVTALPAKVAASAALARLARCDFGKSTYLQPCEWAPCTWPGQEYLATDFSTIRST